MLLGSSGLGEFSNHSSKDMEKVRRTLIWIASNVDLGNQKSVQFECYRANRLQERHFRHLIEEDE